MPSERSFEDLVECAFSTGGDAFDELHRLLYRYLHFFTGNGSEAEEIAQESIITVWQKWKSEVRDPGSLKSWVLQIAHNKAVDKLRQRRSYLSLETPDDPDAEPLIDFLTTLNPEDNPENFLVQQENDQERDLEDKETKVMVWKALDEVSLLCRSCLILRIMQGVKTKEVARLHSCSVRQVERYVKRGKEEFERAYNRLQKDRQDLIERGSDR